MNYSILSEDRYPRLEVSVAEPPRNVMQAVSALATAVEHSHTKQILILPAAGSALPLKHLYTLLSFIVKSELRACRTALVCDDESARETKAFIHALDLEGALNISIFSELNRAVAWLIATDRVNAKYTMGRGSK